MRPTIYAPEVQQVRSAVHLVELQAHLSGGARDRILPPHTQIIWIYYLCDQKHTTHVIHTGPILMKNLAVTHGMTRVYHNKKKTRLAVLEHEVKLKGKAPCCEVSVIYTLVVI